MRLEGLGHLKNPITSSGIEPVAFQLLVNYATADPLYNYMQIHCRCFSHTTVLVMSVDYCWLLNAEKKLNQSDL
jgi:hypothetical protein